MTERRVVVRVHESCRDVVVDGRAAELIALIACTGLSDRTLGMLRRLAGAEASLARLRYACLQVDLTPTKAKLFYRTVIDQQSLGEWTQEKEGTVDAA